METSNISNAEIRKIAEEIFGPELEKFATVIVKRLRKELDREYVERFTKALLTRRKKIAETEAMMLEKGMTLDEIKLHNAYSDGYNARTAHLRRVILGIDENPATGEFEPINHTPAQEPVEPEPIEQNPPTPEPVPEPIVEPELPAEEEK